MINYLISKNANTNLKNTVLFYYFKRGLLPMDVCEDKDMLVILKPKNNDL